MKRILIGAVLCGIMLAFIFLLNPGITGHTIHAEIKLGYCPTMQGIAEEIAAKNSDIKIIEQQSSAGALTSLKSGEIDIALIGRIAKESEITGAKEKRIGEGYTLVSGEKRFIQKSELPLSEVHTYLDENTARKMLPDSRIVFHKTKEEAIKDIGTKAVLISWKDYNEDMEIIVVMDGGGKAKEFRIPVLYSLRQNIESIKI